MRVVFFLLLSAASALGRLETNPAVVDIPRDLLPEANVVFRGRVLSVTSDAGGPSRYVAIFEPDRWYRGSQIISPTLSFAYNDGGFVMGHDCILFQPNTYWIVFARVEQGKHGPLKLVHDCHGALPVSQRLGPKLPPSADMTEQMEFWNSCCLR